jgi:hypothetical protein
LDELLIRKLEELVSTTKNSQAELTEASRTLHHQASLQDERNESILAFLELHLKGLESAVRNEIQLGLHDALSQFGRALASSNKDVAPELEASTQLDIGEIESDDGEVTKDHSIKDAKSIDVEPKPKRKVDLWIDTNLDEAEAESPYSFESPLEMDVVVDKSVDANIGQEDDIYQLPNTYSLKTDETQSPSDERPQTPTLVSMPTPPSLKKLHGTEHFSFDVVDQSYDSGNDSTNHGGFIPAEITSGAEDKGSDVDLDLQSVDVSQSEFQVAAESKPQVEMAEEGEESNCMTQTKKKFSFKRMLPKMKKTKVKRDSAEKKG